MNKPQSELLTSAIHRYGSISYRLGGLKRQDSRFLKLWKERNEVMGRIRSYLDASTDLQQVTQDERKAERLRQAAIDKGLSPYNKDT